MCASDQSREKGKGAVDLAVNCGVGCLARLAERYGGSYSQIALSVARLVGVAEANLGWQITEIEFIPPPVQLQLDEPGQPKQQM